jgi:hypothetical protein
MGRWYGYFWLAAYLSAPTRYRETRVVVANGSQDNRPSGAKTSVCPGQCVICPYPVAHDLSHGISTPREGDWMARVGIHAWAYWNWGRTLRYRPALQVCTPESILVSLLVVVTLRVDMSLRTGNGARDTRGRTWYLVLGVMTCRYKKTRTESTNLPGPIEDET